MKLLINDFEKLSKEEQEEIQDFISGFTTNFFISDSSLIENEYKINCDICNIIPKHINKIELENGIIRICDNCYIDYKNN